MKDASQLVSGRSGEGPGASAGNDAPRGLGQQGHAAGMVKQVAEKGLWQTETSLQRITDYPHHRAPWT